MAHAIFEKYELPTEHLLSKVRQAFGPRYKEALLGLGRALHPGEAYDMPFAFAALAPAPDEDKPLLAEAIGRRRTSSVDDAGAGAAGASAAAAGDRAAASPPLSRRRFIRENENEAGGINARQKRETETRCKSTGWQGGDT